MELIDIIDNSRAALGSGSTCVECSSMAYQVGPCVSRTVSGNQWPSMNFHGAAIAWVMKTSMCPVKCMPSSPSPAGGDPRIVETERPAQPQL